MPQYRILVHGTNLVLIEEGRETLHGFYQTHWVEAPSREQAMDVVRRRMKDMPSIKNLDLNQEDNPLVISIEEVEEEVDGDNREVLYTGLAIYEEE